MGCMQSYHPVHPSVQHGSKAMKYSKDNNNHSTASVNIDNEAMRSDSAVKKNEISNNLQVIDILKVVHITIYYPCTYVQIIIIIIIMIYIVGVYVNTRAKEVHCT